VPLALDDPWCNCQSSPSSRRALPASLAGHVLRKRCVWHARAARRRARAAPPVGAAVARTPRAPRKARLPQPPPHHAALARLLTRRCARLLTRCRPGAALHLVGPRCAPRIVRVRSLGPPLREEAARIRFVVPYCYIRAQRFRWRTRGKAKGKEWALCPAAWASGAQPAPLGGASAGGVARRECNFRLLAGRQACGRRRRGALLACHAARAHTAACAARARCGHRHARACSAARRDRRALGCARARRGEFPHTAMDASAGPPIGRARPV
jgi:hypothetical protein